MFIFLVTCVRASIAWPEVSTMNSKLIQAYLLSVKAFPIKRYLFRSWFRVCWRYPECQAFLCGKVDERREMKVLSLKSTLPKPPGEDLIPLGYRGYNCSWRRKKPRGYSNPCCSAYTDTWTTQKLYCVVRAFAHYGFHNQKPPGLLNRDFPYSERCFCPGSVKRDAWGNLLAVFSPVSANITWNIDQIFLPMNVSCLSGHSTFLPVFQSVNQVVYSRIG